jgi:hypothetical protein
LEQETKCEGKQIQNLEESSPTVSPNSTIHNVDRELESLPSQSIIEATNVHYRARHDLRSKLSIDYHCRK